MTDIDKNESDDGLINEPFFVGEQVDIIGKTLDGLPEYSIRLSSEGISSEELMPIIEEGDYALTAKEKTLFSQLVKRKNNKRKARRHSSYISRGTRQDPSESRTSNVKRQVKEVKKKRSPIKRRSRGRGGGCSTCPGSGVSRFSKKGS